MNTEKKNIKMPHSLILEDRKSLVVTGVSDVDSFDEETITVYTDYGELTVKGKLLHISKLSVETGELILDGQILSLIYTESKSNGTSLLSKLFK